MFLSLRVDADSVRHGGDRPEGPTRAAAALGEVGVVLVVGEDEENIRCDFD